LEFNEEEARLLKSLQFLTSKPVLYVANVSESGFSDNPHLSAVEGFADQENSQVVGICADIESEIAELDDEDKQSFLDDMGQTESGLAYKRILPLVLKRSAHGQSTLATVRLLRLVKFMVTLKRALFEQKR
jgi:ribosome-binding ATPase YchF (GTP1/OBG family)